MYRSYSYNDMPKPITHKREDVLPLPVKKEAKECKNEKKKNDNTFLGSLETDDIILLIIIFALILEDCEDKLLLLALGFIFATEFL